MAGGTGRLQHGQQKQRRCYQKNEKEDQTMKTRLGVLILVFLTGMILGATQPTLLYAGAEVGEINPWDKFVYAKPFPGTRLAGPLSIYYEILEGECDGQPLTNMYYTVRLSKHKDLYTFQGFRGEICLADIDAQGEEIMNFLDTVVVPTIFPDGIQAWKLIDVDNPGIGINGPAFVTDITITVKEKRAWKR
jgi:hypothetical protein